ncbi:MAG: hypothetical protein ONB24_06330 [candidate division KSB1 bacterium]|nr:hypothetical protein [candidate division KSB1 bacterium]
MATAQISLKAIKLELQRTLGAPSRLWAFAGTVQRDKGRAIAQAFAELLKRQGKRVELLSADRLFRTSGLEKTSAAASEPSVMPSYSLLKETDKILQQALLGHDEVNEETRFILVDLQSRCSAAAVDLFLTADLPIYILQPSEAAIRSARIFFTYCLVKALDTFFDDKHPLMRAILVQLRQGTPFSPAVLQRIKALEKQFPQQGKWLESLLKSFSPQIILCESEPHQLRDFSELFFERSVDIFPPSSGILGVIHEKMMQTTEWYTAPKRAAENGPLEEIERIMRRKLSAVMQSGT